jgi:hypothetical protein
MRSVLLALSVTLTLAGCADDVGMPADEDATPTADPGAPADEEPANDDERPSDGEPPDPTSAVIVTVEDDGAHLRFDLSSSAELRLDGEVLWGEPTVTGEAIELAPIDFFRDPGYQAWEILFQRTGMATILATTASDAEGEQRTFEVTIEVVNA